ncbi:hypothetical protein [Kitasatospora indigofera]|uniref:hypothetical protein n=1 Tax=Kitasatospora indigofera TaxID=67307 RepID=UPI003691DF8F
MTPWTPARATLDDLGPFDCLTDGATCANGFALPRFTMATVRELTVALDDMDALYPGWNTLRVAGGVVEVWSYGEAVELCPPDADGLYSVGHGYWTWQIL